MEVHQLKNLFDPDRVNITNYNIPRSYSNLLKTPICVLHQQYKYTFLSNTLVRYRSIYTVLFPYFTIRKGKKNYSLYDKKRYHINKINQKVQFLAIFGRHLFWDSNSFISFVLNSDILYFYKIEMRPLDITYFFYLVLNRKKTILYQIVAIIFYYLVRYIFLCVSLGEKKIVGDSRVFPSLLNNRQTSFTKHTRKLSLSQEFSIEKRTRFHTSSSRIY